MNEQIILQGISLSDFLQRVEQASYDGQKRAIIESKAHTDGIDWDAFKELMNVEDICKVFPVKKRTAMKWITERKFGNYSKSGKLLLVPKVAVHNYYKSTIKSIKR